MTKVTQKKAKDKFLTALKKCANVAWSARRAHVSRKTVYEWRKEDPIFAEDWDNAREDALDELEKEIWRRAMEGVEKPIYQGGKFVDSVREYSDSLAMFIMKANRKQYRDRVEYSGVDGGPITIRYDNDWRKAPTKEKE